MFSFLPYIIYVNIFNHWVIIAIIFQLIAILVGIFITIFEVRRLHLNVSVTLMVFLLYFVLGNLFARGLFVLSRIYLHQDFNFQDKVFGVVPTHKISLGILSGLVSAVFIGTYVYNCRKKFYKYLDAFFLGYLATFFIRIGDSIQRTDVGKITSEEWGSYYFGNYRHNPGFYEATSLIIILVISFIIRKKVRPGIISLIIICWTSLSRFLTDSFRADDLLLAYNSSQGFFSSSNYHLDSRFTLNQIAYGVLFLVSFGGIVYLTYYKKALKHKDKRRFVFR